MARKARDVVAEFSQVTWQLLEDDTVVYEHPDEQRVRFIASIWEEGHDRDKSKVLSVREKPE